MIQARGATLEKRQHQHDAQLLGQRAKQLRGGAGDRFRLVEHLRVFRLAKIKPVVQLLQHHQLGALGRSLADALLQLRDIGRTIGAILLLY